MADINAIIAVEQPKRPPMFDPSMTLAACAALMSECEAWQGWDTGITASQMARCADSNGYSFAKNLDNQGLVDPDPELVEILDSYWYLRSSMHDDAVKQWVKDHAIALPEWAAEGVKVLATGSGYLKAPGIIARLDPDMARLVVCLDEDAEKPGHIGIYFIAENVEVAGG